jgi:hypothetical protein
MRFGPYAAPECRSGQIPTLAVQEWTASSSDRSDRDTLTLMRRYLAEMLACAAPTVTFGACPLQGAGLIRSRESADPVARRNACMRHTFNRSVKQDECLIAL